MGSFNTRKDFKDSDVWALMTIILVGFVLYLCPLKSSSFYFDDHVSIENNAIISHVDIPRIFNAFNTRFLVGLSFALNYKWGALNPACYKLTNLLIHCFNAFLVYLLIKSTLFLYSTRKFVFFCRLEWIAFLGGLLFLCHPIQTEPVNFITQRFVLMGTFFYLLAFYLYIQYRLGTQKIYLIASMGAAIAAMFCKEFVVTLPIMLTVYDFYFLDPANERIGKRIRRLVPFFAIALIVPILLLRTPSQAIGVANIVNFDFKSGSDAHKTGDADITRASNSIGRKQYFLTELNVVCTYLRLLFLPINQNFDYDYPLSSAMSNKTALSGLFLLCLLGVAVVTYRSYRVLSFCILWFFVALSVESSFIPIGQVIAEYRVYLASVGFAFLLMLLIYMKPEDQKKLCIVAVAILIGSSILTYQRNKVWRDEFSLWNDVVPKSPHKSRPYLNRGYCYLIQGKFDQSMADFDKAIAIDPNNIYAYNNRGYIYQQQGKPIKALIEYSKAIMILPQYIGAYYSRGSIFKEIGSFQYAIADFKKIIEIDPNYADAYMELASIYVEKKEFILAVSNYTKVIQLHPQYALAYNKRAFSYYLLKEYSKAWSDVRKAEELGVVVDPEFIRMLKNVSVKDG